MGSLAKAVQIKEVAIDGNPVTLIGEYASFLVSYLPNLQVISTMHITEHMRRAALAWRTKKEQSHSAFLDLSMQVRIRVQREEVISNAKTNWERLRYQTGFFANGAAKENSIQSDHVRGMQLQKSIKLETASLQGLDKPKSKICRSLTSLCENIEAKKKHLKPRNNFSDSIINSENKMNAIEFKLPPLLIPIIHNISRNETKKYLEADNCTGFQKNILNLSSDSERESSESYDCLKSGLRCHLMNFSNRGIPFECEANVMHHNKSMILHSFHPVQDVTEDFESYEGIFNKTVESFLKLEDMVTYTVKPSMFFSPVEGLKSKSNSLDSATSALSNAWSSPLKSFNSELSFDFQNEKGRLRNAQQKEIVYYKANKAVTARSKQKCILPASPPPQSNLPKQKEQGMISQVLVYLPEFSNTSIKLSLNSFIR